MTFLQLTDVFQIPNFDCGDEDLNGFIRDDAKLYLSKRIANTYLLVDGENVVAYLCLLNDKISKTDLEKRSWRKVLNKYPGNKHFRSYPSIKIGRFAVDLAYQGNNIGSFLISGLKKLLLTNPGISAFRYITVDVYSNAVNFYLKNGFHELVEQNDNCSTHLMYFDLLEL